MAVEAGRNRERLLKSARRVGIMALAALLIFAVDRDDWPLFVIIGAWCALLVLAGLASERRRYPKPLLDLLFFSLLALTVAGMAVQAVNFLWQQDFAQAMVLALFIFVLIKALMDFLDKPLVGAEKRSVVLTQTSSPMAETRREIL